MGAYNTRTGPQAARTGNTNPPLLVKSQLVGKPTVIGFPPRTCHKYTNGDYPVKPPSIYLYYPPPQ